MYFTIPISSVILVQDMLLRRLLQSTVDVQLGYETTSLANAASNIINNDKNFTSFNKYSNDYGLPPVTMSGSASVQNVMVATTANLTQSNITSTPRPSEGVSTTLIIIIAASVGGGLFLILFIVIIARYTCCTDQSTEFQGPVPAYFPQVPVPQTPFVQPPVYPPSFVPPQGYPTPGYPSVRNKYILDTTRWLENK
jgi:hypothetical protein